MKSYNFYTLILGAMLCSVMSYAMPDGGLQEFSQTITEEYQVDPDATVHIYNKYGDVDIVSSDRSTVHIIATIYVEARSQDRADEIFEKINISIDGSRREVTAETEYDFNNNWSWGKKNENYKVHYKVQLPKTNDLDIENKYGNISITDMQSDVSISLKYGNANINDIGGDFEAELGYVKSCTVGRVGGDADLELSYSDIELISAADIDIESKYSDIEIAEGVEIDIESKYDKYEIGSAQSLDNIGKYDHFDIGSVGDISIETKYTHLKIEELFHSGDFSTGYGGVKIRQLHEGFESIIINSKYTGYDIGVDGGYRLDVDTEYVGVDYPRDFNVQIRDKDGNDLILKGHYLNAQGGLIEAVMRYGHLNLD